MGASRYLLLTHMQSILRENVEDIRGRYGLEGY